MKEIAMIIFVRTLAFICLASTSHSMHILETKTHHRTTSTLRHSHYTTPSHIPQASIDNQSQRAAPNNLLIIDHPLSILDIIVECRMESFQKVHIPILSEKKSSYGCYLTHIENLINAYMIDQLNPSIMTPIPSDIYRQVMQTYFAFNIKLNKDQSFLNGLTTQEKISLTETKHLIDFFSQHYELFVLPISEYTHRE